MPPLPNVRQEKFVQGLFEGKSATQSYIDAGYKPSQPNSSRMTWYDMVQGRLRELQEAAARTSELTVESLLGELEELRAKAVSREQYAAGVRAVSEKIKLAGFSVQRLEVNKTVNFTDDTPTEEIIAEVLREYGPTRARYLCLAFDLDPDQFIARENVIDGNGEVIVGTDPEIRHASAVRKTFKPAHVDATAVVPTRRLGYSQRATEEKRPVNNGRKREI